MQYELVLLTFLPLLGALAIAFTPKGAERLQRLAALATTLVVAALGVRLFLAYGDSGSDQGRFLFELPWFSLPSSYGADTAVNFKLGLDGVSLLMVTLTAVLMPIVILSTWGHVHKRVKEFMVWMLVMQTGMLGTFLALDLVLFYFFWEISLIPLYFLIGIWGGERRLYATVKFFLYTLAGSLVMMVAIIWILWTRGTSDVFELINILCRAPLTEQLWLFAAFALAFGIKVPLLPFHTWLPDAHTEAPTSGSVVLAGVLLKMGTYGLVRFCIHMLPGAAVEAAPVMMALGAIGILYGALLAWAQDDLKRLIACSSVSHLGYVVLGLFALTPAGINGGMLQMVNHGISTGLLFLLVGMIYERRHSRALDAFGGVAVAMPLFALFWVITTLSSVGLPGLNGFVGEYLVLVGAFQASPLWAIVGLSGVIFGAVYMLMATRRMLFGALDKPENRELTDLNAREIGLMLPLVALVVWLGVSPNTFMAKTQPSIEMVNLRIAEARRAALAGLDAAPAAPASQREESAR
ncbi:MAG: NADH-quinone oxidoreductase subunit M [Planctomycetes bacterium]|nr:NADH-quinone oxidoreductase subunit M [Planctomycetota bacterium]